VTAYAELDVTSNFTFMTGASKSEALVRAAELGYRALGVATRTPWPGWFGRTWRPRRPGSRLCRLLTAGS